jgi:hypothetical protein
MKTNIALGGCSALPSQYLNTNAPSHPNLLSPSPPITDWMPGEDRLISKKAYLEMVKMHIEVNMHHDIKRHLSRKLRKKIVAQMYGELKPIADRYWKEYATYLKSQGWVEKGDKTELPSHCEWLVRYVVCKEKQKDIASIAGRGDKAISKAVREVSLLIDLPITGNK